MASIFNENLSRKIGELANDEGLFPEEVWEELGRSLREEISEIPEDERDVVINGKMMNLDTLLEVMEEMLSEKLEQIEKLRGADN